MIQATAQMRILVAIGPVDFRRGSDGLAQVCRTVLSSDPFSGTIFVFRNRRKTSIKCLVYDGQGFWILQKRLSQGTFRHWPSPNDGPVSSLQAHELHLLIHGGNPNGLIAAPTWRRVDGLG